MFFGPTPAIPKTIEGRGDVRNDLTLYLMNGITAPVMTSIMRRLSCGGLSVVNSHDHSNQLVVITSALDGGEGWTLLKRKCM